MALNRRSLMAWQSAILACAALALGHGALAEDKTDQPATAAATAWAPDARLQEIIKRVEANEPFYQHLETVVRFRRRYTQRGGKGRLAPADEARWHTVLQGDLLWFRSQDVTTLASGEKRPGGTLSVFDGQVSRHIEYGNCVNIRQGRYEPWQITPPHAWAMHHFHANFPLSVFLRGTDAVDKHPKPRRFARQGGSLFEFAKLEATAEPDETIDGLNCAKVRCRRWYQAGGEPTVELLWLAKDRNYLCVRSQTVLSDRGLIGDEGTVIEWRELKPGLWLPSRVVIKGFAPPGWAGQPPVAIEWQEELIVDEATPDPDYPLTRFADVTLPDDLPVYRVDADGYLEYSPLRTNTEPRPQAELDGLIALVRAEEERYARYDASVETVYRNVHARGASDGAIVSQQTSERSAAFDGRLYSHETSLSRGANGATSESDKLRVYDGDWNRERVQWWHEGEQAEVKGRTIGKAPGAQDAAPRTHTEFAMLGRGGPDAADIFRPHTAIFAGIDNRLRSHRLSSLLASPMYDEVNSYRLKVSYLGPERRDGLDCEKLWFAHDSGSGPPTSGFYLWLATDRNYLPIRYELYSLRDDKLPKGIGLGDDLRQVSPGLWCPFHTVYRGHVFSNFIEGFCEGRVVVHSTSNQRVRRLELLTVAPDDLFQVNLPAGLSIGIFTGQYRELGAIQQAEPGQATISDEKWQAMLLAALPNSEERQQRKQVLAALVGRPMPEVPEVEWMQGGPHAWETLKGQVVLLFFWAEWHYPKFSFKALPEHADVLADSGVVVIGIHARGSALNEVRRSIAEFQPHAAIAIDAPGASEPSWGALHESFGVKNPTHAFVIGRDGKIAAEGSIDRMIRKAGELARKD
jgi:hypothetical protein